ncbi:MAG: hypothetical protein QOI62_2755 [Solirubrobacteraceae bacterium]|jgi:uncharacterized protein (DUF2236 family)|nr:hypothetical protein [Solirubrobacteraceae bacterium]
MSMSRETLFTDDSMLRRVIGQKVVGLSGPRALLMQAAHPVAFAGFFAHTGALDEPYERLRRTARVLNLIAFGPKDRAQQATRRVRAMHRRVHGELAEPAGRFPAGTPYAADDPALLLWILATVADSAAVVYQRYVGSLSADEREGLWADYRVVGREFGLRKRDMPATWDDFQAYMADMVAGEDLHVSDSARELAVQIVMRPPVALHVRPLVELTNQITIGLLPTRLRRAYGFRWDPVRAVAARGGAEYAKRLVVPFLPERMRLVRGARRAA